MHDRMGWSYERYARTSFLLRGIGGDAGGLEGSVADPSSQAMKRNVEAMDRGLVPTSR